MDDDREIVNSDDPDEVLMTI